MITLNQSTVPENSKNQEVIKIDKNTEIVFPDMKNKIIIDKIEYDTGKTINLSYSDNNESIRISISYLYDDKQLILEYIHRAIIIRQKYEFGYKIYKLNFANLFANNEANIPALEYYVANYKYILTPTIDELEIKDNTLIVYVKNGRLYTKDYKTVSYNLFNGAKIKTSVCEYIYEAIDYKIDFCTAPMQRVNKEHSEISWELGDLDKLFLKNKENDEEKLDRDLKVIKNHQNTYINLELSPNKEIKFITNRKMIINNEIHVSAIDAEITLEFKGGNGIIITYEYENVVVTNQYLLNFSEPYEFGSFKSFHNESQYVYYLHSKSSNVPISSQHINIINNSDLQDIYICFTNLYIGNLRYPMNNKCIISCNNDEFVYNGDNNTIKLNGNKKTLKYHEKFYLFREFNLNDTIPEDLDKLKSDNKSVNEEDSERPDIPKYGINEDRESDEDSDVKTEMIEHRESDEDSHSNIKHEINEHRKSNEDSRSNIEFETNKIQENSSNNQSKEFKKKSQSHQHLVENSENTHSIFEIDQSSMSPETILINPNTYINCLISNDKQCEFTIGDPIQNKITEMHVDKIVMNTGNYNGLNMDITIEMNMKKNTIITTYTHEDTIIIYDYPFPPKGSCYKYIFTELFQVYKEHKRIYINYQYKYEQNIIISKHADPNSIYIHDKNLHIGNIKYNISNNCIISYNNNKFVYNGDNNTIKLNDIIQQFKDNEYFYLFKKFKIVSNNESDSDENIEDSEDQSITEYKIYKNSEFTSEQQEDLDESNDPKNIDLHKNIENPEIPNKKSKSKIIPKNKKSKSKIIPKDMKTLPHTEKDTNIEQNLHNPYQKSYTTVNDNDDIIQFIVCAVFLLFVFIVVNIIPDTNEDF